MKKHLLAFSVFNLLLNSPVWAGGFATDVPSAAAMANSYSGQTTGMHNIADMFVNPAVLTEFSGNQINVDLNYIAPDMRVKPGATARTHPALGDNTIDTDNTGSAGVKGDVNAFVPMLYGMWDLQPDLRLGLGITVPWGLSTEYPDEWLGRYHALKSEIKSLNISPVVAYQLNNKLSMAGGLQIQYFDASLSSAIDFGSVTPLVGQPNLALDGKTEINADDWGYGFKLGLLFTPNQLSRIGLSYRSKINHSLEGDNNFTVPDSIAAVTAGGQFVDTGMQTDITTPETVSLGASYQLTAQLSVSTDATWTHWSRVDQLVIHHDNPLQADSTTLFNWSNSWYWGAGVNYQLNPDWLLRTGIAYEQSPVTTAFLTPRLPVNDKYFISFGASHSLSDQLSMDFSYIHEFFQDANSNLGFDDPNNFFRGSLNAGYEVGLDAVALSFTYKL